MRFLVSGSVALVQRLAVEWPDRLGFIITPANRNFPVDTGLPWAADNGAFKDFDEAAFRRMLGRITGLLGCLFVVVPDVWSNSRATLELFHFWVWIVRESKQPIAFVGQDGVEDLDVPWDLFDVYFVGGSDAWRLSQASEGVVQEARQRGKGTHFGRVNTRRRINTAVRWGCDSVDGSIFSRMSDKFSRKILGWLACAERPALFTEDNWWR